MLDNPRCKPKATRYKNTNACGRTVCLGTEDRGALPQADDEICEERVLVGHRVPHQRQDGEELELRREQERQCRRRPPPGRAWRSWAVVADYGRQGLAALVNMGKLVGRRGDASGDFCAWGRSAGKGSTGGSLPGLWTASIGCSLKPSAMCRAVRVPRGIQLKKQAES